MNRRTALAIRQPLRARPERLSKNIRRLFTAVPGLRLSLYGFCCAVPDHRILRLRKRLPKQLSNRQQIRPRWLLSLRLTAVATAAVAIPAGRHRALRTLAVREVLPLHRQRA